jgi:hypothetical protein
MAAIDRTLTIANGATDSPIIEALELAPAISIIIIAPATLPETVNVKVARRSSGTFTTLQTNAVDIVMAAGKATQITVLGGVNWKLVAGGAVAGARDFEIVVNRIGGAFGLP